MLTNIDVAAPAALPVTNPEAVAVEGDHLFLGVGDLEKGRTVSMPTAIGAHKKSRIKYARKMTESVLAWIAPPSVFRGSMFPASSFV